MLKDGVWVLLEFWIVEIDTVLCNNVILLKSMMFLECTIQSLAMAQDTYTFFETLLCKAISFCFTWNDTNYEKDK